jgi:hypothetical protein
MLHVIGSTVPGIQNVPAMQGYASAGVGQYIPPGHFSASAALQQGRRRDVVRP